MTFYLRCTLSSGHHVTASPVRYHFIAAAVDGRREVGLPAELGTADSPDTVTPLLLPAQRLESGVDGLLAQKPHPCAVYICQRTATAMRPVRRLVHANRTPEVLGS